MTPRVFEKHAGDSARKSRITRLRLAGAIALSSICAVACKDSPWTPMGTAQVVLSEIKLSGAAGVSRRLDTDESFARSVLNGIATGDSAWLAVASQITPPSAPAEASLAMALASALPHAPSRVLAILGDTYSLEEVCGIPFVRPDSSTIVTYEEQARAALQRLNDSSLAEVRDACVTALEAARKYKLERVDPSYILKNKPGTTTPVRK
ncbi:MAG: hypothetical protein ACRENK_13705 [Gemmatimonadaceae bacterium]